MRKAAILTLPLIGNYGGILQNYALQKVILSFDILPTTINRLGNKPTKLRRLLSVIKNNTYNKLNGSYRTIYTNEQIDFFLQNTKRFIEKHIRISPEIRSQDELLMEFGSGKYDLVVVGSDQTWRPRMSADIYNYFLDFLEEDKYIKRIAYASSFGTDEWELTEKQTIKCKNLIKKFNAISVREDSGVKLCYKYLDIKAEHVLDPTLLLLKDDYLKLTNGLPIHANGGIFTYILDRSILSSSIIDLASEFLKMDVYENQPKLDFHKDQSLSLEDFVYPSIEGWLSSFNKADFVITDSFHGTVFSIIFNKPFITLVNKARGSTRIYSLLKQLNLESRIIVDLEQLKGGLFNQQIDFCSVNSTIDYLRNKSLDFLKYSLC